MRRQQSPPAELLEQHRRDIETLDRRVLHLVRERLDLARQIGELKRSCGVPLRNFQVEAQVHRRFEDACEDLGLDPRLGHDLALFLIERAVEEQAALMDSDYRGDQLRTLVVGGKGGMGSWIARFLAGQGHRVSILDPASSESPFLEIEDLGDLGELRALEGQLAELLALDDVIHLAAAMEPGSTAGVLVWENVWAAPFGVAARKSGGQLIASGRIPTQALVAAFEAEAETTEGA